ncbi:hypothetical protein ACJX0J_010249, partial [Zea mays]
TSESNPQLKHAEDQKKHDRRPKTTKKNLYIKKKAEKSCREREEEEEEEANYNIIVKLVS